ncbi:MAG: radical SAM-associated putative lipoprotein, partial [Tannerella sp.]|nr:radical SAM-associated putative lipoprotein [Tannerella sp.]
QTDKNGMFNLSDTPGDFMEYTPVAALDVDNEKNGLYRPDTLYVDYTNAEHIGDGKGWLQGELTSTIQFELEEDKDE